MKTSQDLLEEELSKGENLDLARAALAIAADEYRGLEPARYLARLDHLASRVLQAAPAGADLVDQVVALRGVLADEEGLSGNLESYDDPRNSFLNEVLDRKLGIPITLSVIYAEVARRAGIPVFGVAFPAHFCAGVRMPQSALVIDAFDRGRLLDLEGCRRLFMRVVPGVQFTPDMIRPARPTAVLYRMLNNLKLTYFERGDSPQALRIINLMLAVEPDHPAELRARASILTSLGHFKAALSDVNRCLALSPEAPDARSLQLTADALRQKVTYLN